jgi:hypothetical protein
MLTNVFDRSSVFICCTVASVVVGAFSHPTQASIWSGWSATSESSSAVVFFIHSGSSTFLPSGGVRIATTWLVRSRP